MNRFLYAALASAVSLTAYAADVKVSLTGLEDGDKATLSIVSNEYIDNFKQIGNGEYVFRNVPDGSHSLKLEASGYKTKKAISVKICDGESVQTSEPLEFKLEKLQNGPGVWSYYWQSDDSPAGYTTTAHVNNPPEIEFLGKKITPSDVPYSAVLLNDYKIILEDSDEVWTQEYAYRLVETFKSLCYSVYQQTYSKFILTSEQLPDDILIERQDGGVIVRICKDAFAYANPFLVNLDGVKGRYFSKRLHHALTNLVTDYGKDTDAVNKILTERYGCTVSNIDYETLTSQTTQEGSAHFQEFVPQELVYIINMFEEMPEGFHKVDGLKYLVRRINGMKHPLDPNALAVAWPELKDGYIEFMEIAFTETQTHSETLRVIIHEKAHFLWQNLFSEEIKNDWAEIGGWYQDSASVSGWSTTKEVEFVSEYAHKKNPNEDMAESIAYFLNNPEKLMSRSPEKYEFVRDRIMHGVRYVSSIPDHLTFEVLNLYPDYDYPGRVDSIDITVTGNPEEDKMVQFVIQLLNMEGFNDSARDTRIHLKSPAYFDEDAQSYRHKELWVGLRATDEDGHRFEGRCEFSKYMPSGFWTIDEIVMTDHYGNQRFEGEKNIDAVVYLSNPLEDTVKPVYEEGSLSYELRDIVVEGHNAQILHIEAKVTDNIGIRNVWAYLRLGDRIYSQAGSGYYDAAKKLAQYDVLLTEFHPSGFYYVCQLEIADFGDNRRDIMFSEDPWDHQIKGVDVKTANPDYEAPEIDLNRILVYAEPTNPEAPDGETKVTIHFYVRDDKSGFRTCRWVLRDPQGLEHYEWFYNHRNIYTTYFDGDPTLWERYTINCILPVGSVPGIWGLAELTPYDKVDNWKNYNFVETMVFEPENDFSGYELFANISDNMLCIEFTDANGNAPSYSYRIIHEQSGKEISGAVNNEAVKYALKAKVKAPGASRGGMVDVSGLPDGDLLVIANAYDENGEMVSVKSTRVSKSGTSSLEELKIESRTLVNVYNIQGICLKENVEFGKWSEDLTDGLYIVGSKKILLRHSHN